MYYVYVLRSLKYRNVKIYIGFTSDVDKRVVEHNRGETPSTRYGMPWKLVYYEAFFDKSDAIKREGRLKKGSSTIGHLKSRIKKSLNSN